MDTRPYQVLVLALGAILWGCGRSIDPEAALQDNRKLDEQFAAALQSRNLDAVMECWRKDEAAVRYPADNMAGSRGWESIRSGYASMFKGVDSILSVERILPEYQLEGGVVVGQGIIRMKVSPRGSTNETELLYRYTDIREHKSGHWVYTYSHESMDPLAGVGSTLNNW